jgi:signal transduction histidine kinase
VDIRGLVRRHGDQVLAGALVVGICVQASVAVLSPEADVDAGLTARDAIALVAAVLLAVSLAWRRRAPLIVLGMAILAAAVAPTAPVDGPLAVILALMVATYSVGAHTPGREAIVGMIGVGLLIVVAVAKDLGPDAELSDVAVPTLILGMPWLAGVSVRSRQEREAAVERGRLDQANAAVAEERARIARELHDAVAHAIGIIVLQARGARRTLDSDPASARAAIDAIEVTASDALGEMRGFVGLLRDEDAGVDLSPPPSLRHIESLVAGVREAGLPVDLSIEGIPVDLPAGLDASAYRIVQEALTNALAHSGPATATVLIRYDTDRLELEIGDTGIGSRRSVEGHGLHGMRERVSLHDGSLEMGPRAGGGFVVRATLPIRPARA